MKRLFALLLLFGAFTCVLNAQHIESARGLGVDITCGIGAGSQDAMNALEEQWLQHKPTDTGAKRASYTLPIVFHVIHENGPENVSEANIQAAVANLNLAFANVGYYDQGTGAETDIEFCLAQRLPGNLPTNGITRIVSPLTEHLMSRDDDLKALVQLNPLNYINVYVVKEICRDENDCSVAGYAYYPNTHGSSRDGIVLEARFLNAVSADAVVLIHELGHYLGLYHTFEGGCTNDDCNLDGDRVCDTPPDGSTVASPCDAPVNSCNTDTDSGLASDLNDQMNNYMDYNFFRCVNMFSEGQVERMTFFLENVRTSLLQSPACFTPCPTPITADFDIPPGEITGGQAITLTSTSTNAEEYCWYVDGVLVSTATTFIWEPETAGTYQLSLTAKRSGEGCFPDSTSRSVVVNCPFPSGINLPDALMREGGTYTITSEATGGGYTTTWLLDGQIVGNSDDLSFNAPATGFYELCLRLSDGACTVVSCTRIAVGEPLCPTCPEPEECVGTFQLRFSGPSGSALRDVFSCVLEDGNRLYVGGAYGNDPLVVATDPTGAIRWQTGIDLGTANGRTIDLKLLPGGDLVGLARRFANNRAGGVIFRIDAETGSLRWAKRLNASGRDLYLNDLGVNAAGTELILIGSSGNRDGMFRYFGYQGVFSLDDGTLIEDAQTVNTTGFDTRYQLLEMPSGRWATVGNYSRRSGERICELNMISPTGETENRITFSSSLGLSGYAATRTANGIVFLANSSISGTNNTLHVWETDLEGNLIWNRAYSPDLNILAAQISPNEFGYLIHGEDNTGDQLIIQIGPNGGFGYAREIAEELSRQVTPQPLLVTPNGTYLPGTDPAGRGQSLTKLTPDGRAPDLSCVQLQIVGVTERTLSISRSEATLEMSNSLVFLNDVTAYQTDLAPTEEACPAECLEICDNGLDDDLDGFTDCLDPDLAEECCCRAAPVLDLGPDTLVCQGFVLKANIDGASYRWSDGSANDSIVITATGTVTLSLTDECGTTVADTITLHLRPRPQWSLGNDTTICDNAIVPLRGPEGYVAYEWNTGEREANITTDGFGSYQLAVTDSCGLVSRDTLNIIRDESSAIDLGPDQLICPGEAVSFSLNGFSDYSWTQVSGLSCTDCADPMVQPDTSILLGVSATFATGCFTFDTVRINVIDTIGTNTETLICLGDTLRIGEQLITASGTYYRLTGNDNCPVTDTIRVTTQETPFGSDTLVICAGDSVLIFDRFESLPGDYDRFYDDENVCDSLHRIHLFVLPVSATAIATTICGGDSLLIDGTFRFTSGTYVEVNANVFGCDSVVTTELTVLDSIYTTENRFIVRQESVLVFGEPVSQAGIYQRVYPSANGCDSLHEVTVERVYVELAYVPNAFSPNLDGVNDDFRIYPSAGVDRLEQLQVFNRWGQLVFEVNDVAGTEETSGWDGDFNGRKMPAGVYIYSYILRLNDGSILSRAGNVMLLR